MLVDGEQLHPLLFADRAVCPAPAKGPEPEPDAGLLAGAVLQPRRVCGDGILGLDGRQARPPLVNDHTGCDCCSDRADLSADSGLQLDISRLCAAGSVWWGYLQPAPELSLREIP